MRVIAAELRRACKFVAKKIWTYLTKACCFAGEETYQAPVPGGVDVKVDPNSKRLQLLEPFKEWDGNDIEVVLEDS